MDVQSGCSRKVRILSSSLVEHINGLESSSSNVYLVEPLIVIISTMLHETIITPLKTIQGENFE